MRWARPARRGRGEPTQLNLPGALRCSRLPKRPRWLVIAKARADALRLWRDERGAITAEFALVLPACIAVLGLMIGAIALASHRVSLTALAGEIARLEARGDRAGAEALLSERALPKASATRERSGAVHCVTVTASPGRGPLAVIPVSGRSCAAIASGGPVAPAEERPGTDDAGT